MKITLNNVPVYVATGGKDFNPELPTVLFLHGSGGDHRTWALQTRWFAYHGYSVLAPDLPGHSLSGGQAFSTIEESGPWLADFLGHLGVRSAHIIGHSQGFLSALELYKTKADVCASLCAVATAAAIPVNQALIDMAKESSDKAAQMMCNWGFGLDLQACADYTKGDAVVPTLEIPTHCILASADKMTPLRAGKALSTAMGIQPTVLEGYGHMLPLEAPKQTLGALREFLQNLH